jgi:hypothetical protein
MNHWDDYWVNVKNPPLLKNPSPSIYGGTNHEPLASIGMTSFFDAIKNKFVENLSVLDYGCGAGILINPLSERLNNFTYYGLEPISGNGPERINLGKSTFIDPRINFGFIETDFDNVIKNKIDVVILISIFTHLIVEDINITLDRLIKVFDTNKNSTIVFSCFIEDNHRLVNHQPNIWERFYGESYITLNDLETYCNKNNLKLIKHMDFIAMGGYNHQIFKIEK